MVQSASNSEDASNRPEPPRIVLADDHPLFQAALRHLLTQQDPNLEVVAEVGDGREALEACRNFGPDLVLMDLGMPSMDGIEATRAIKREFPRVAVLVLTAHEDTERLSEAIEAGASGYVLKSAPPQRIADAIRRTLAGETPLDQELSMRLLTDLTGERSGQARGPTSSASPKGFSEGPPGASPADAPLAPSPLAPPLSAREVEVLRLMAQGYTNQQIARALFISTSTVKNHVQRVLAKLGASDRTQAAIMAVEMGLLSAP